MKKIIYSNYTKFIAVLMFIISIVFGVLVITDGASKLLDEKDIIYNFESDFSEAQHFSHLLDAPESAVFNAYHNFYLVYYENETVDSVRPLTVNGETLEQHIKKRLDNLYCADKIDYYVKWNDTVFTNCGATSEEELMTSQFYRLTKRDENGNTERESSQNRYYSFPLLDELSLYDEKTSIVVGVSVKEDYVKECKLVWNRQAYIVNETFTSALTYVILALIMLIYLLCVCGKNKDGEHRSMWVDNIWIEIHLAFSGGIAIGAVVICVLLLDEYFSGHFPYDMLKPIIGLLVAVTSTAVITSLLSIVRNIKCKKFIESSIIVRVIKWCWRIFVKVVRWVFKTSLHILKWLRNRFIVYRNFMFKALSRKTGAILIGTLFVYTALIGILGIGTIVSPAWLILGIILFAFASFVVAYRAKDLDEIKKGVSEVRGGNVAYKIPELKCDDLKVLATNVNDIAKGLENSVSAKIKAERLKTELITNVSHDLKTPITSIISYTELLSQIDGLPEEARDYVSVISKKSERLKNLTQDLFDISKVQSGNEDVVWEKLDVALLINQSLGEHDNEIQKSELPFCVNAPKDLYIHADGRKMSRVLSNLINNILKYSMKNTRVFITATEKDGEVIIEFKNIASYPMNFSADEIVGRFVRGDESRTKEGNGLGLAIAKSYTEICNGKFEIVLDGDMFKTLIIFKKDN